MAKQRVLGNRYEIQQVLGEGGMAKVFLGTDRVLSRTVAVKVLAPQYAEDQQFVARFRREAQAAAALNHPNIVSVFDTGSNGNVHYIVMEYVEGKTLQETLREESRLTPERSIEIGEAVARALSAAHAKGLVHRDIKPGNIMITREGQVKVMDFGIARATTSDTVTQTAAVLGTAAYLSPEQAAGEPVTAAADIYGLGVVLYELLTGRTPFVFESVTDLVAKHRESTVTPVRELEPAVPEALEAAVMTCLARNPDYRPASAAGLAHELAAASPEPPTVPLPPTSGVRATDVATVPLARPAAPAVRRRPDGRVRRGAAATALVVLALGAVAAGYWVAGRGEDPEPARQSEQPLVEPVPSADDPGTQARNLSAWLRDRAD